MKKRIFFPLFLLLFIAIPVGLAIGQDVYVRSTFQSAALLVSVAAFGIMLGLFWLTRLLPRGMVDAKLITLLKCHKVLGYLCGLFLLAHPVLMIARRFWAVESNPIDNFILLLRSPLMLPGIIAWALLLIIVLLALFRRALPAKLWRMQHRITSIALVLLASWHVLAVGRHNGLMLSIFWGVWTAAAVLIYLPKKKTGTQGAANGKA